jgi:SAM-dependent methyltransferase
MGSIRVNYDDIATRYDDRRRDCAADERLAAFLAEGQMSPDTARVLDVGCGTGKQLAANRTRYPRLRLTGVDASHGMLRVAAARDATVCWLQGDAQALPLQPAAFDYVTNQFSYPHIADKRRFAGEIFRVLRPGGRFVLTNIDPWAMEAWALYRYFPEARALDERDFVPRDRLVALLAAAGFDPVRVSSVDRSHVQDVDELLASASRRYSASQLMAIPDGAYAAGLQRLRDDRGRGTRAVHSPFVVITIEAGKPA